MKTILTSIFVILSMALSITTALPDSINNVRQNTSVMLGGGKVEAFVTRVCSDASTNGTIRVDIAANNGGYTLKLHKYDGSDYIFQKDGNLDDDGSFNFDNLSKGSYVIEVYNRQCAKAVVEVDVRADLPSPIVAPESFELKPTLQMHDDACNLL